MAENDKPWWEGAADAAKNYLRLVTGGITSLVAGNAADKMREKVTEAIVQKSPAKNAMVPPVVPPKQEDASPTEGQKGLESPSSAPATLPSTQGGSSKQSKSEATNDPVKKMVDELGVVFKPLTDAVGSKVSGAMQSVAKSTGNPLIGLMSSQNLQAFSKPHPEIDAEIAKLPDGERLEFEKFKGDMLAGMLPSALGGGETATDATKQALSGAMNMPGFNALAYTLYNDTKDLQGVNAMSSFGIPVAKKLVANLGSILGNAWQAASQAEGNFIDKVKAFFMNVGEGFKTAVAEGIQETVVARSNNVVQHAQALGFDENATTMLRGEVLKKAKEKMPSWLNVSFDNVPPSSSSSQPPQQPEAGNVAQPSLLASIQGVAGAVSSTIPPAQTTNASQVQATPLMTTPKPQGAAVSP
jgi:hypothetical protein